MIKAYRHGALLAGIVSVLVLVSWQGLSGPLVFDDLPNLSPLTTDAPPDYRSFIFNNQSGGLGRTVSMSSFALNHWLRGGFRSFDLKITNLAIHVVNGVLLYWIILLLLQPTHASQCGWVALIVSACWLLSPMNSGVVFYAIQRVALLACFFVFAGILFYTLWRRGRVASPIGRAACLVICALCWPLATLSKENGILLPVLVLIVEFCFFSRDVYFRALRLLLLSMIVGGCVAVYVFHTSDLFSYENRHFTLVERLSTQPVVIGHYVRALLLPASVDIGIFNDDFPVQNTPWNIATLSHSAAIALLLAICLSAKSDSRYRAIRAGVLFYFAAHAAESTALPLELYFEHRNYLPSAGLFLAAVLAVNAILARAQKWSMLKRALPSIVLIWFGFLSYQAARAWTSWPSVVTNMYQNHPLSARAGMEMAALLLHSGQGAAALQVNDVNGANNPSRILPIKFQRFYIFCDTGAPVEEREYRALTGIIYPGGGLGTSTAFELLLELRDRKRCSNVDFDRLMLRVADMVDASLLNGLLTTAQAWHVEYFLIEHALLQGRSDFVTRRVRRSIEGGNTKAAYYSSEVLRNGAAATLDDS